jgi:hypothetical protein
LFLCTGLSHLFLWSKAKEDSPEKKLRAVNKICGDIAELMRHRISAFRTKKNADRITQMKRKLLAFLKAATKLDSALRQANKGLVVFFCHVVVVFESF